VLSPSAWDDKIAAAQKMSRKLYEQMEANKKKAGKDLIQ